MASLILCLMDVQTGFKQKMEASLRYLLQYSFYQWITCKLYGSYVWRKNSLKNKAHPILVLFVRSRVSSIYTW